MNYCRNCKTIIKTGISYCNGCKKTIIFLPSNINVKNIFLSLIILIITLFFFYSAINYWDLQEKKKIEKDSQENLSTSIWLDKYTDIENFEYYIEGENIYLTKYKGENEKVRINNIYEINNKSYNVVSFPKGVFALGNVYSVILPEGLTSMANNTFNCSNVKYLYIPSTLQKNEEINYPFWKYFNNVEIIYYGGTEEQWNVLVDNANREDIDVKEIIYNTNIEDLK